MPPIVELHSIDDVPFLTPDPVGRATGRATACARSRPSWRRSCRRSPRRAACSSSAASRASSASSPIPDRMAAAGVSWLQLTGALQAAAVRQGAGTAVRDNRELRVEVGPLFQTSDEVGARGGRRARRPARLPLERRPRDRRARRGAGRRLLLARPGRRRRPTRRPAASTRRSRSRSPSAPGANATALAEHVLAQARRTCGRGCCPRTSTSTSRATTARPRRTSRTSWSSTC